MTTRSRPTQLPFTNYQLPVSAGATLLKLVLSLAALSLASCLHPSSAASSMPDVSSAGDGESTIGPTYTDAPELTPQPGTPRGTIKEFVMHSQDSKIYPGIANNQPGVVPYSRKVAVYIPAGYQPGTPLPFIIVQDGYGMGYKKALVPTLDNMIQEKRLPAMAAIFIDSGGGDAQGSERGLEYDTVSGKYSDFIESEVLPKISHDYNLTFSADPDGRATMGGSSGAACAFTMAWFHPERYHRVLSYSGTFVNQQSPLNPETPHGAWEYHEHLIPAAQRKPIRIWMEVAQNDIGATRDEASLHNWVMANRRMAAVLKAKGYHYTLVYAQNAGHVDERVMRQTLPEAMAWLWRGYPIK